MGSYKYISLCYTGKKCTMNYTELPPDLGKVIIVCNFLLCDIWPSEIKQTEISKCQSIKYLINKRHSQKVCCILEMFPTQ